MEHRGYTVTLNYFNEDDMNDLLNVISKKSVDYYAFCFEGVHCDIHHAHIHLSIHFKSSVQIQTFKNYWSKKHHVEVVKDFVLMHEYIKGYEDGKLKCEQCGDNDYYTEGEIPKNGIKKNVGVATLITNDISSGMNFDELCVKYPAYMLNNHEKVKNWINMLRKEDTKFYRIRKSDVDDPINSVIMKFSDVNLAVIHELSDIEAYNDVNTVLFIPEYGFPPRAASYWPRGVPILYKYGYITKTLKCKRFIIVCDTLLFGYKKI